MINGIYAPLFKGIINTPDRKALALVQGTNPDTDQPIGQEAFIRLMEEQGKCNPMLVTNIARAAAAAALAVEGRAERGEVPTLVSVEGCNHNVGGMEFKGGELIEEIWQNPQLHEMMCCLPKPDIRYISRCTLEEIRTILEMRMSEEEGVAFITGEYHVPRVRRMVFEEAGHDVYPVHTPAEIAQSLRNRYGQLRLPPYIFDVIRAGEPDKRIVAKEQFMEHWYGSLHTVSRWGEKITGGRFNLEINLAHWTRQDLLEEGM